MSNQHVCPLCMAPFLDNPLRILVHNPKKILKGLLSQGNNAVDLGCGPGAFTIDMAKMVGPAGKIYAVDLQEGMLKMVAKKSKKYNVDKIVVPTLCSSSSLEIKEKADFILAFYMLHESDNPELLLKQIYEILKPAGKFLLIEPKMHIDKKVYLDSLELAKNNGFKIIEERKIIGSWAVVLAR